MKFFNDQCPDANTLAEFIEGKLLDKEHAHLSTHISGCPDCRDLCAFAAAANAKSRQGKMPQISAGRKKRIQQNIRRERFAMDALQAQWQRFTGKLQDIFNKVESAEVIAAGEEALTLTFASSADTPAAYHWKMQLAVSATAGTSLAIRIRTPKEPSVSGKLIFCGNELAVSNGRAAIAYETLKASFTNPEVAFIFTDNTRVAGFPVL